MYLIIGIGITNQMGIIINIILRRVSNIRIKLIYNLLLI